MATDTDAPRPGPGSAGQPRFKPVAVASVTSDEQPYGVRIDSGGHALRGDEPASHGGGDTGPAPFGLLLAGLGACTSITLRMYAERKQWPVTAVHADIHFKREDKVESIDRVLHIEGAVDAEQKKRMAEIAERTPVTLTLKRSLEIHTTLAT